MYGYGTAGVNDQRIPVMTRAAFAPMSYGPALAAVPTSQPNVPPGLPVGSAGMSTGAGTGYAGGSDGYDDATGYGTADLNAAATAVARANPFSFKDSPVLPAVIMLLIGLIGLRMIHWRRG